MTVNDIVRGTVAKLGNRTDLTTTQSDGTVDLYRWIADAVKELTESYSFEELHCNGSTIALTENVSEYNKFYWTNGGEPWTDVLVFRLVFDATSGAGWNLEYRDISIVDNLSRIQGGPPTVWALHGSSIIVGLKPNQAYDTYWRYQKLHPFSKPVSLYDKIYMPESWKEIVEYAAALRGAVEKRASDWIQLYDTILNGDEEHYRSGGKYGKPGLIFGRVSQEQRNKTRNSRQFAPVVQKYGVR